jgi:hypothetical protein
MSLQLSCLSEDFGVTGVEKVEVAKRVSCLKHLALPLALPREACKIIGFLVRLTWELQAAWTPDGGINGPFRRLILCLPRNRWRSRCSLLP